MTEESKPLGHAPEGVNVWRYELLVRVGRSPDLLWGTEVGKPLGLFQGPANYNVIAELLGEISRSEVADGRSMLSSVVWHSDLSGLGVGLRNVRHEFGLVRGDEDDLAFATRIAKATFEYSGTHA